MSALLAFDTSTEQMSVGFAVGERTWVRDAPGGAQASSHLLPTIMGLLRSAGSRLADLDAIAFGRGPGAFTGLRTACSVAQGLALGASKPVLAIDTLMAVAEDARQGADSLQLWVTMDARMDQLYAGQYRFADRSWKVLDGPLLVGPEALNKLWDANPPLYVAGNGLLAFCDRLNTGLAPCRPQALPRAAALLSVAATLWAEGAAVDPGSALPSYLRDKVAQTVDERAVARSAGPGAR